MRKSFLLSISILGSTAGIFLGLAYASGIIILEGDVHITGDTNIDGDLTCYGDMDEEFQSTSYFHYLFHAIIRNKISNLDF